MARPIADKMADSRTDDYEQIEVSGPRFPDGERAGLGLEAPSAGGLELAARVLERVAYVLAGALVTELWCFLAGRAH